MAITEALETGMYIVGLGTLGLAANELRKKFVGWAEKNNLEDESPRFDEVGKYKVGDVVEFDIKKEYKKKGRKPFFNNTKKTLRNTGLIALLAGTALLSAKSLGQKYFSISEQDFQNAKWYSANTVPFRAYMNEKIPHNSISYETYKEQVAKKNGSLENATMFPDLDGDGKVGPRN